MLFRDLLSCLEVCLNILFRGLLSCLEVCLDILFRGLLSCFEVCLDISLQGLLCFEVCLHISFQGVLSCFEVCLDISFRDLPSCFEVCRLADVIPTDFVHVVKKLRNCTLVLYKAFAHSNSTILCTKTVQEYFNDPINTLVN